MNPPPKIITGPATRRARSENDLVAWTYFSKAPILIWPLEFTRGLPLKSTVPKSADPRLALPVFSAGEVVGMSKFGAGEHDVMGVGGLLYWVEVQVGAVMYAGLANTECASCPVPDW